jgi:hypothetical protein
MVFALRRETAVLRYLQIVHELRQEMVSRALSAVCPACRRLGCLACHGTELN